MESLINGLCSLVRTQWFQQLPRQMQDILSLQDLLQVREAFVARYQAEKHSRVSLASAPQNGTATPLRSPPATPWALPSASMASTSSLVPDPTSVGISALVSPVAPAAAQVQPAPSTLAAFAQQVPEAGASSTAASPSQPFRRCCRWNKKPLLV